MDARTGVDAPHPDGPGSRAGEREGAGMNRSEAIDQIASALAKAQARIEGAKKDKGGNYGKYATLASVVDACKQHLTENGIAFVQTFDPCDPGKLALTTTLMH